MPKPIQMENLSQVLRLYKNIKLARKKTCLGQTLDYMTLITVMKENV
jgi:hypothetical protein